MPAIVLAEPYWLLALPAAAGPAVLAMLARRRGRHVPLLAILAQSVAVVLIVLALAEPLAPMMGKTALPYVALLDESGSVRGQTERIACPSPPGGGRLERLGFSTGLRRLEGPSVAQPSGPDQTLIAPPLRLLAAEGKGGIASAIIYTDGRFTDEDWLGAARALGRTNLELLIVPLDSPPADARIVRLEARRAEGASVELNVTVWANANVRRMLVVRRADLAEPLLRKPLQLLRDVPAAIPVADQLPLDRAGYYSAQLTGQELIDENNSAATLLLPVDRRFAAAGFTAAQQELLKAVEGPVELLEISALPSRASALSSFSAVIVNEPTGTTLSDAARQGLAEYARSGGGLLLIGAGPHAKPADEDDALNRVLPLLANPYQRRPLSLRVLLDRSGSMAERTSAHDRPEQVKFDLAVEAVLALRDHLTQRDSLEVIVFADQAQSAYDSGQGPADFAKVRDSLAKIRPQGSTKIVPALELTLAKKPAPGQTPMLLVLSDLQTQDALDAHAWAGRIKDAGAILAVVAIGQQPTGGPQRPGLAVGDVGPPPVEQLARLLDAPYERRDHLAGLAAVFGSMVQRGRGEAARRGQFQPRLIAPAFGSDLAALPPVDAYFLSAARPEAQVLASVNGDPLLASMQAGLGRSVALAVPLTAQDNANWPAAPAAQKLIASAVKRLARPTNDSRYTVTLQRRQGRLHVVADVQDDRGYVDHLVLTAVVASPSADATPPARLELPQAAPGRYEAQTAWPENVPAAVEMYESSGTDGTAGAAGRAVWQGSAEVPYAPEYAALGADYAQLQMLAQASGARIVRAGEVAAALKQSYRRHLTELWPWLLAAALAVMLGEWASTRITRR